MSAPGEPGPPPAIVFIHATRLTGAQWDSQVRELSDEFRCFAPDLPGHGTAEAIPFTLGSASSLVAEVIETEAFGRAVVVGLSLGGYVAMELAAARPDLVAGLAIAGASAEPRGPRSILYLALATVYDTAPEAWLQSQQTWMFRRRYPRTITDPILAGGFWFHGGASAVRALVGEQFRPRLGRYPGPTLIVNGEADLLFRVGARSFAAAARHPHRVLIRGAGHRSSLDRPRAFSAAIRSFAREVASTGD